jgi:hypothetical protein
MEHDTSLIIMAIAKCNAIKTSRQNNKAKPTLDEGHNVCSAMHK